MMGATASGQNFHSSQNHRLPFMEHGAYGNYNYRGRPSFRWGNMSHHRPISRPSFCRLPKPPSSAAYLGTSNQQLISIKSIDSRLSENSIAHHTNQYYLVKQEKNPSLVVRRGQGFLLNFLMNRCFDPNKDAISLIFEYTATNRPDFGHKSLVAVPLLPKGAVSNSTWSARVESCSENITTILIIPAANCLVGEWSLEFDIRLQNSVATSFLYNSTIFILFNPWCKDDQVYLTEESHRQEYVLMDSGLIWRGTLNQPQACAWRYAQFEKDILECSLYLVISVGRVAIADMGDPVKMSRALSASVNSSDDAGALQGKWSTNYQGGTAPTVWLGSMKILQQYWKTKKTVKYAQCWVFSGVMTTIARALGIPSRVVTNYSSAHDSQNSTTVDFFFDENGKVLKELNTDSIWNYHVWNEVWMRRPDLSDKGEYDGWQALDATPQEMSDGMFRCGPASIKSVKKADLKKPYDCSFIYSEVNADQLYWRYFGPNQPLMLIRKDTENVGRQQITKAVGKWEGEDVTQHYKFPEKTQEERDSMLTALTQSESIFSRYYLNEDFHDCKFELKFQDDILIGLPFTATVIIRNTNKNRKHQLNLILRILSADYMSKIQNTVKEEKADIVLEAGEVKDFKCNVTFEEYFPRLVEQSAFQVSVMAKVLGTNYEYVDLKNFRVRKPDIKVEMTGDPSRDSELKINAYFSNPLPIALKKGQFSVEGAGLLMVNKIKLPNPVNPKNDAKIAFTLPTPGWGRHTIVVKFESKELVDVDGFLNFNIKPSFASTLMNYFADF